MPTLREFHPFIARGRVGPHEYTEYMPGDEPAASAYINEPTLSDRDRPEDVIPGWRSEKGLPPTFFGDPEGRAEMEALDKEAAGIRGETEEILGRISEKYTPEQISAAKEKLAARRKPPEGFQVPEFSDTGRHRYEQGIFREIQKRFRIPEGNPFKINPMDGVDQAMTTQLPKLFKQVFGGRILFSDANRLEGKALKYWNEQVLKFKAGVFKKAEYAIKRAEDYHTYAMSKYDTERKRVEGKLEQQRKEALKPPEMKLMVNDKGEQTWHEYKPEMGTKTGWVDTGKLKTPEKEEKPEKPEKITGQLTEKQVLDEIQGYLDANARSGETTKWYAKYRELYKKTKSRADAYNQTMKEIETPALERKTVRGIMFEKREDGKWYPRQ